MKSKSIELFPSDFFLDVFISDKPKDIYKLFHDRHGREEVYYEEQFSGSENYTTVLSCNESGSIGESRLIIVMDKECIKTLVHELIHVLFYAQKHIGLDISDDSQEWVALLYEYMYTELSDFSKYDELKV